MSGLAPGNAVGPRGTDSGLDAGGLCAMSTWADCAASKRMRPISETRRFSAAAASVDASRRAAAAGWRRSSPQDGQTGEGSGVRQAGQIVVSVRSAALRGHSTRPACCASESADPLPGIISPPAGEYCWHPQSSGGRVHRPRLARDLALGSGQNTFHRKTKVSFPQLNRRRTRFAARARFRSASRGAPARTRRAVRGSADAPCRGRCSRSRSEPWTAGTRTGRAPR